MSGTVKAAEAVRNGDGEIALFVPPLGARPLGWREEDGEVVTFEAAGGRRLSVGCPPEALLVARERGRLLLVEVGASGPVAEWWLPDLTDAPSA